MAEFRRYRGSDLRTFLVAIFEHYGVSHADAVAEAESLVRADEMGIDSHGVAHIMANAYIPGLRSGEVDAKAQPEVVRQTAATALMDAHGGLGGVATTRAMELAIEKARSTGAGFVAVSNSRHFGAAAYYALLPVEHGMLGLSMTIGGLGVVPTYGRGRRLGINPLAFAAPSKHRHPFLLDIATSVVAGGKLELARMNRRSVPLGWIVDRAGKPTTNTDDYYAGGALLPLGGTPETGSYKGYGLAVMIDILCGVLTGMGFAASLGQTSARPHFVGAIDIAAFRSLDDFTTMMDEMIDTLGATEPAQGAERVLVHGEREFDAIAERTRNGIPLHPEVVDRLTSVAEAAGVPLPAPV
jgi:LDH2 family malate/lactate/ureidoglycolate dehydrogenase